MEAAAAREAAARARARAAGVKGGASAAHISAKETRPAAT